jgi:hypothetical protein
MTEDVRMVLGRLAAFLILACAFYGWPVLAGMGNALPNAAGTLKLAVIGDNGTGKGPQYEVGARMADARRGFPFDFVLMLGDNFYGSQRAADLVKKFADPYRALLDSGVTFHAVIGNHDELHTVNYPPLNMGGQRYYTLARGHVRFFALDTNSLDPKQVAWFESALASATEPWKIAFFHHPLYSSAGRHGSDVDLRLRLEPLLVKYGVSVVLSGHDHIYERVRPQKGITYFVVGASGQLRKGDLDSNPMTAAGFDDDRSFMLVEIGAEQLWFETIARSGVTVDSGIILRRGSPAGT